MGAGRPRSALRRVEGREESSGIPGSRFQVLAHPSFFRLPIVGKLLERASAKASPHFLLLKLPQEEARWQVINAGRGLEVMPTPPPTEGDE